jgi:hypothetical protein
MSKIRRINVSQYEYDDVRRYITAKDCLSEPEVLKAYCENHPKAICLGGYGYFGCLPEGKKKEDFIKYDFEKRHYITVDGRIIETDETYCGRKIPCRVWKGKKYLENRIWAIARLGIPDLLDGDMVIEAKGGLPSSQKIRTALGQLLFYGEHEPSFDLGFLFLKIWLEAENLQNDFSIFRKYKIYLLPI